tara:strand:+ start:21 stop:608 length:588 start_codon:yes stop_codon:yes gene_type:complete
MSNSSTKIDNKEKDSNKNRDIFTKSVINKKVSLEFQEIGSNMIENIKKKIKSKFIGKCCKEGYINDKLLNIISFSPGVINGNSVIFDVIFECLVCRPIIGQMIKCKVKNITKAGIRAQYSSSNFEKSPITVYLARDNHYKNEYYNSITENKGQEMKIRTIGVRFELNDDNIYVLGELVRIYTDNKSNKHKIKIEN